MLFIYSNFFSFSFFIYSVIAFILGRSRIVFLVTNPIHSILSLIGVFFLGTCLLFFIEMEYYAMLFLIVYVGAIVVLFLFIIRMLEIKRLNIAQTINDSFFFRHIIMFIFILSALLLISENFFDLSFFINSTFSNKLNESTVFIEANSYIDWSKLIQRTDQLHSLGGLLYTEYKISVILASILLFLAMVGALALTLYFPSKKFYTSHVSSLKFQDPNNQARRFSRLSLLKIINKLVLFV